MDLGLGLLALGVALFMGAHAFSMGRGWRAALAQRLGDDRRKGVIALGSALGLLAMIAGYRMAEFTPVYDPPQAGRAIAHALVPLAFVAFVGGQAPSNLKRWLRHPMSIGVALWAVAHLAANGDLASLVLFGAFLLFALTDVFVTGRSKPQPPRPLVNDVGAIALSLAAYVAVGWAHGVVFGVPVFG